MKWSADDSRWAASSWAAGLVAGPAEVAVCSRACASFPREPPCSVRLIPRVELRQRMPLRHPWATAAWRNRAAVGGVCAHGRDLAFGKGSYLRDTSTEGVMLAVPLSRCARGRSTSTNSRSLTIFRSLLLLAVDYASLTPGYIILNRSGLRHWADLCSKPGRCCQGVNGGQWASKP